MYEAEEWVSSTPRHVLLYEALGMEPPLFRAYAHDTGFGSVPSSASATAPRPSTKYKEHGFLPETMFNSCRSWGGRWTTKLN